MADDCASLSCSVHDADRNSRKRKIVSTTESEDSVYSPTIKRYKLPATTIPCCIFGEKSCEDEIVLNYCRRCTDRSKSTNSWGPQQTKRLNFKNTVSVQPLTYSDRIWERNLLSFLFETLEGPDARELSGPEIVTNDVKERLLELCIAGNPVQEYLMEVINRFTKTGFPMQNPRRECMESKETYLMNMIKKDRQSKKYNIPEVLFGDIKGYLVLAFWLCCIERKPEGALSKLIKSMMQIIQLQDDPYLDWFQVRDCTTSKVTFDICGSNVTSTPNIIWEIAEAGSMFSDQFIPIILSENKGNDGENEVKQTAQHPRKKKSSVHMKIPQVIGQCISVADKSIFETKDFKIVYHVSLMSTNHVVITRTHVAKSTLKVIKDGRQLPDQNDLDPSYVLEYPIHIKNHVQELTVILYSTLQIFEKLTYMLLSEKPETEGENTSHEVFETN